VQHTDLVPTLLDLLDIGVPGRVTGRSVLPAMASGASGPESIIIGWGNTASLRNPEWNYIGSWNGGPDAQLYDLKRDPDELRDLAVEHPKLVAEFRGRVQQFISENSESTKGTFATIAE
jgi:arylsulfatase A-like enzyme